MYIIKCQGNPDQVKSVLFFFRKCIYNPEGALQGSLGRGLLPRPINPDLVYCLRQKSFISLSALFQTRDSFKNPWFISFRKQNKAIFFKLTSWNQFCFVSFGELTQWLWCHSAPPQTNTPYCPFPFTVLWHPILAAGTLGPVQTSNFTCAEPNTYLGRPKLLSSSVDSDGRTLHVRT